MEDAIALVRMLDSNETIENALTAYDANRRAIVRKFVTAAEASANWYDQFGEKVAQLPKDFALDYLMRSGRMSKKRLHSIAPEFMKQIESNKEL